MSWQFFIQIPSLNQISMSKNIIIHIRAQIKDHVLNQRMFLVAQITNIGISSANQFLWSIPTPITQVLLVDISSKSSMCPFFNHSMLCNIIIIIMIFRNIQLLSQNLVFWYWRIFQELFPYMTIRPGE